MREVKMEKYKIKPSDIEYFNSELSSVDTENFDLEKVGVSSGVKFLYYHLGLYPRVWQTIFLKKISESSRLAVVTPRQVGKTTVIASESLRYSFYNLFPDKVYNRTVIGIVSATEPQAMKIIEDIKNLMYRGDKHIENITGGLVKKYFTKQIAKGTNKSEIRFKNGSKIVSLPATDSIRGYTFSLIWVDEGAFIEDETFLQAVVEPTVRETEGKVIITTTPKGVGGVFYKLFDPFDERKTHKYERLWIGKDSIVEKDLLKNLDLEKQESIEKGTYHLYLQEYEAEFISETNNFFNYNKVKSSMKDYEPYKFYNPISGERVYIGVDFGMVNSKTVVTVTKYSVEKEVFTLLNQFVYNPGEDHTLVEDVFKLYNLYGVSLVVVDDCPEGYHFIQRMENMNLPLYRFKFRTEKNKAYNGFRDLLGKGKIVFSSVFKDLFNEMTNLREIQKNIHVYIKAPNGGSDDRVDSFVMSVYPEMFGENKDSSYVDAMLI